MAKLKYFNNSIEPSCQYCQKRIPSRDERLFLCERLGVVSSDYSCKRFVYDPLKRIPKRSRKLPTYDKSDFEL